MTGENEARVQPAADEAPETADKDAGAREAPAAEPEEKDHAASTAEREAAERLEITEQLAALIKPLVGRGDTYFTNLLLGPVDASMATFGPSRVLPADEAHRRTRTGRFADDEVAVLCEHFAEPPRFWEAAAALNRGRVIVLTGEPGRGKRASAVRLLLDAGAAALEVVSPLLTLEELSKHDFVAGHGYLVEDWQQAARANGTDDYNWRLLRDHVNDSKAYLVITTVDGCSGQSIRHFPWTAPTAAQVLAAYLVSGDEGDEATAGLIAQVVGKIPGAYPDTFGVGSVASIGRRLAQNGNSPQTLQEILQELSSDPGRYVREWLSAEGRTDDDIQRATVLCFAASRSERVFEVMLIRLERALRDHGLIEDPDSGENSDRDAPARRPGLRALRTRRATGLVEREGGLVRFQGSDEGQQHIYHRHAVRELWREYDMNFWIAVRDWLDGMIGDPALPDIQTSVAVGLSMLAYASLDEVEDAYLRPWASGARAWPGQRTAVYVLWLMSRDDSLSPAALRIATDWANSGNLVCQWTAAAALSGELGAAYPAAAATRLWHLVGQWRDVPTRAVFALANLFATLTTEQAGREAPRVLELLRGRMEQASVGNSQHHGHAVPPASWRDDKRNRERARLCIVAVLAVRDPVTQQPSITSFLNARPECQGLVAELWAEVLRNRPLRKRALVALLDAVRGFEFLSDEPEAAARSLGDALTEALPKPEHHQLSVDFMNIVARSKRPEGDTAATVRALLKAFEHLRRTERATE